MKIYIYIYIYIYININIYVYHAPSLALWRTSLGRYPLTYGYSLVGRVEEVGEIGCRG